MHNIYYNERKLNSEIVFSKCSTTENTKINHYLMKMPLCLNASRSFEVLYQHDLVLQAFRCANYVGRKKKLMNQIWYFLCPMRAVLERQCRFVSTTLVVARHKITL